MATKKVVRDVAWLKKKLKLKTMQKRIGRLMREGYSVGEASVILIGEIMKTHKVGFDVVVGVFTSFWGPPQTD